MSPGVQIVLSGALSFGVPLALAAREVFVLRRRGGGPSRPGEPPIPPAPPPLSWQPSLPPLRPCSDGSDGGLNVGPGGGNSIVRERELA